MENAKIVSPTKIATDYKQIISKFKNRFDVQNGEALGYRKNQDPNGELKIENKPKSIGYAMNTTGWCVSVSQALLLDKIFQLFLQSRGAVAKLISIDIKEQYYGHCYSGSQNKWHTAILVYDNNTYFVIDMTCGQFGNQFNNRNIWDFKTWEASFRSPVDKHIIKGFKNENLSFLPKIMNNIPEKRFDKIDIINKLHNITNITDGEREFLSEFFVNKYDVINTKLNIGNITKFDYKYLDKLNYLIKNFNFVKTNKRFAVLQFENKGVFADWLTDFIMNDGITKHYMLISDTLEGACQFANIDVNELNCESYKDDNITYCVFEFTDISGFDIDFIDNVDMLIPYGIKLHFDQNRDIYNSADKPGNTSSISKKTNTVYINASN